MATPQQQKMMVWNGPSHRIEDGRVNQTKRSPINPGRFSSIEMILFELMQQKRPDNVRPYAVLDSAGSS
jgi:hypothetical protein